MVLPCLYFMWIGRNRPSMAGLVHLCTFILLLLSGERNFGVSLNKPYANVLPLNDLTTFTGTSADLLIIVCHKLAVNAHRTCTVIAILPLLMSFRMTHGNDHHTTISPMSQ